MAHYLVAYDIFKNSRRRKVAKLVYSLALGGQKSALETVLSKREADHLRGELELLIDGQEDKVNIIQVMPKAILLGMAKQLNFNEGVIII